MTQAAPQLSANSSRLVRYLNELSVANTAISPGHFAQRLAQLIDFSASIALAGTHGKLQTLAFEPTGIPGAAAEAEFLRVRAAMMQSVIKSIATGTGPGRSRLPEPAGLQETDPATACAPYLKFYAAHQAQLEFKTRNVQSHIRDLATGLSPELARLCALDAALGDTLAQHSRKFFTEIPRLLGQHFEHLLHENPQPGAEQQENQEAWTGLHERFRAEMQGLLLAEIEARLLPVLGLIEAINEDKEKAQHG